MTGDWFSGYLRDGGGDVNVIRLHKHACDTCGDFGCTRPGCLLGGIVTHQGHKREINRRKARGFDGPEGQPAA